MREIKFRAWTNFKTMVEVLTINFATSEAVMPDGEWYKVKLMQYTGLKDRNGVEIYEGDIVREYLVLGDTQNLEVLWDADNVEYTLHKPGYYTPLYKDSADKDCEVIGNIYENPDLLASDPDSEGESRAKEQPKSELAPEAGEDTK